jgi:hypothetical protein
MLTTKFGIEIEFTGITREKATKVAADFLNGTVSETYCPVKFKISDKDAVI